MFIFQADSGRALLLHFSQISSIHSIPLNSLVIASKPGAFSSKLGAYSNSSSSLKNYRGVIFSPLSDVVSRNFFAFLFKAIDANPRKPANKEADIESLMNSLSSVQRSPLILLLAFSAFQGNLIENSSDYLSRFMLYRKIHRTTCDRKITEALVRTNTLCTTEPFVKALDRLLSFYAMALRMLSRSSRRNLLQSFSMQYLFGLEVAIELEKDISFLAEQLAISFPVEDASRLPYLLQTVDYYFEIVN